MLRAPFLSAVFVFVAAPVALAQGALSRTMAGIATDEECEPWGRFRLGEDHVIKIPDTITPPSGARLWPSRPSDAVPAGPDDAPDGSNGPAGHGNGSVTIEGEFTFTLPIAEAPQNAAERLDLAFLYRSEGCGSAMPGFHADWHFNAVDQVTINLGPGGEEDPQAINWLNGLGNKYDFLTPVEVQGPAGFETWWNEFGSPFSRFRLYWPAGIPTLERYTARGSVTRYEKRYVSATQTIWRPRYHWVPTRRILLVLRRFCRTALSLNNVGTPANPARPEWRGPLLVCEQRPFGCGREGRDVRTTTSSTSASRSATRRRRVAPA